MRDAIITICIYLRERNLSTPHLTSIPFAPLNRNLHSGKKANRQFPVWIHLNSLKCLQSQWVVVGLYFPHIVNYQNQLFSTIPSQGVCFGFRNTPE